MVPAGKLVLTSVMSKESVPLPVFCTVLVNVTVLPCVAEAIVWPESVTPVLCVTVNSVVFALNGPSGVPVPGS